MAKIDEVGQWSREKLDMLRQYLAAYTSILNLPANKRWCKACHYVDAFSGGVRHIDKESYELIDGSPLLALKTTPSFSSFTFIDKDHARIRDCIEPLQKQFPTAAIHAELGDCNEIIKNSVLQRFSGRGCGQRGFMFLDPYGINLHWDTVEAIGNSGVYDVLINFSVMGVYRQLGDKPPSAANRILINKLMGCEDWFSLVYKPTRQLSLLDSVGTTLERHGYNIAERLADFYRNRLMTCFKEVSRPVMMRNQSGGPLYALILGSHAKVAVIKMHEIFDRNEKRKKTNK